ncbi:PREDICTED: uncharacterized protein LOC104591942 [Nelumbo nucifera]|uniref:Uncharacterized protein LOC104591942 n=1 Tax=Nelumbo nucifera TaxID=4432 RepID=A0A1U7ZMZ9_NELNU|nr:PREDICTED: uncharacterized protein LOC104591942 [Nelumbo nucifera]
MSRRSIRVPSPVVWALDKNSSGSNAGKKAAVPNSNYVVPLDNSPCFMRPLEEILRDLNKRVPNNIIKPNSNCIPWYHANRMLSFYAPAGWCGEVRDVIFSDSGSVTLVYRLTIRGSDGEDLTSRRAIGKGRVVDGLYILDDVAALKSSSTTSFAHRESTGTVSSSNRSVEDPVAAAEEIAFCRACARFGLGLYLYHEDETVDK